jgi:hypothetical protein
VAEFIVTGAAVLLVAPGFALLYYLHQRGLLTEADSDGDLRLAARMEQDPSALAATASAPAAPAPAGTRTATALVLAMLTIRAVRDMLTRPRRR